MICTRITRVHSFILGGGGSQVGKVGNLTVEQLNGDWRHMRLALLER
jgi:hypothetical protein